MEDFPLGTPARERDYKIQAGREEGDMKDILRAENLRIGALFAGKHNELVERNVKLEEGTVVVVQTPDGLKYFRTPRIDMAKYVREGVAQLLIGIQEFTLTFTPPITSEKGPIDSLKSSNNTLSFDVVKGGK